MNRPALVLVFCLALLAGCATTSRFGDVENELAAAAGVMTLEEAIDRWGQPTTIDRGELLTVAYWEAKKQSGFAVERLYLTFDNGTKKMKAYRYQRKPFD